MFFRKQRRAPTSQSSDGLSSSRTSITRSRSPFSLSTTLSRTSLSSVDDVVDNVKGPLGLNLLCSPSDPQVDIIFVHGLGGGSRKTWSKTPQRSHYWPQEWLPKDPGFKVARIHSYGYDSDYLKGREDCLNIHHIGKSFLAALSTSPCFIGSETSIIVVGHSMGGLVIKKAIILAKQDSVHKQLARRFAAVYFLATPHRGADSAKTLKNMLKVAYDRAYVAELERNSGTIQVINDEFRHFSTNLELWSFYETQNMKMFSSLIVDPESAVLGYREERQMPVNADHRSICKYETPTDSNYVMLRNALSSTVNNLMVTIPERESDRKRDRVKVLKQYLEIPDVLDDDLANAREARMPGSCRWLSENISYRRWIDGSSPADRILWMKGKPATGKSVLAGYIIDELQQRNQCCSYFFFKHGDKSKSRLSRCLKSIAFQMACLDDDVGIALLEMANDGVRFDHVDERTLWRTMFMSKIFEDISMRHFWVIDALDECSSGLAFVESLLAKMNETVDLRILITGRDATDFNQAFSKTLAQSMTISETDTLPDLRLLVETRTQLLGVVGFPDRPALVDKILLSSRGSFLWTALVLKELQCCHSKREIDQILENVPKGMVPLYKRTLASMAALERGKKLAKAILLWATCAFRPITTTELHGALLVDIEDNFPNLDDSIASLCGQLVVVDGFKRVQMIHETAREFLLGDDNDSEFSVQEQQAHTTMARVCLTYLTGDEMKPPRGNRRRSSANLPSTRLPFAAYAQTAFSYHLAKANSQDPEIFQLVEQFFRTNVLSWIAACAELKHLNQLIRTSKHLRAYVNACSIERSPLDPRIQTLKYWTADLTRLPAMFSNALIKCPAAIYSLIPPFCPTRSMVYNTNASGRRLLIAGSKSEQWDDRLLCVDFREGSPSSLAYGEDFLAVGLTSGSVVMYYTTSYQEHTTLLHGEATKLITFKRKSELVATCGLKFVKVWNARSGALLHSFKSPPRPLSMDFEGDSLLISSHKNFLVSWDLGSDLQSTPTQTHWSDGPESQPQPLRRPPSALALSVSQGMLAVAYHGKPIMLWDIEEKFYVGNCGKRLSTGETSTHVVVSLAFNPNPNLGLLAVAYLDGDLALLDPFSDQQLECFRANYQTLASSPNGRLLAASGANGIITVHEFDTLRLLYRVRSTDSYIKQIVFAPDNLLFADIRGAQCTVWKPETLLRDSLSDDSSGTTSASLVETVSLLAKARITSIAVHNTADAIFCGKDDGSVSLYSRKTAVLSRVLWCHKSPVRPLKWCPSIHALLAIDASNRILLNSVHDLDTFKPVFESRLERDNAIVGVVVGESADRFMVSTREADFLYALSTGELVSEHEPKRDSGIRKWVTDPARPEHVICVDDATVCIYGWVDLAQVACFALALRQNEIQLKGCFVSSNWMLLETSDGNGFSNTNSVAIFARPWPGHGSPVEDGKLADLPLCTTISAVLHVLGTTASGRLVFLASSGWICSADLSQYEPNTGIVETRRSSLDIFRHFFVPSDWFAGNRGIACSLADSDIIVSRGGELAVIKGGYDYSESVDLASRAGDEIAPT